jgi:hypothetical protein
MSRTVKVNGSGFFRRPRTQNSRVTEQLAKDEILEAGYRVRNRLQTRANLSGTIPTAYDDLNYSTRPRY